VLNKKL